MPAALSRVLRDGVFGNSKEGLQEALVLPFNLLVDFGSK